MKIITKLKNVIPNLWFNQRLNQPKVLLGRWTIDYCEEKINKKIDLSNEDHCGTCNNNNHININNINKIIFFETM
jgi:hypothetical protein